MRFQNGKLEFVKNGKKIITDYTFSSGEAFIYDKFNAFKLTEGVRSPLTNSEKVFIDTFVNNYKIEEDINELKRKKKEIAKKFRKNMELNGLVIDLGTEKTIYVDCSLDTQNRVANTLLYLSNNPEELVEWKTVNGPVSLGYEELKIVSNTIGKRVQDLFKEEAETIKLIDIAETSEDLQSIYIGGVIPQPRYLDPADKPESGE